MQNIDRLTLELFSSKSTYQKYLAKTDPKKAEENKLFKTNLRKYSRDIMKLTQDYLNNPDQTQVTLEINEMLDNFGKTWIRYFEMKELENPDFFQGKKEDEDMLFDENQLVDFSTSESSLIVEDSVDLSTSPIQDLNYPFLNKNIKYSMDYYRRNR